MHVSLGIAPDLPGLVPDSSEPWFSSDSRDDQGVSTLAIWKLDDGAWFRMRYCDGTEFLIDRHGKRLWATWRDPLTVEDTATYLLGPVMGFVLLLRGTHALHASAVTVDGRVIAVVGPAGAGKSTTAAAFAKLGYSVLADDVVALSCKSSEHVVHPAYPCIRLWPDSVETLFGTADALPLLTPNWDKRYLALDARAAHRFQSDALPLAAIYLLGERSDSSLAPWIEAVAPRVAMIELVRNAYAPNLKDKSMRAEEFNVLHRVVASVPVRRAVPSEALGDVSRLCEVILEDYRAFARCGAVPGTRRPL